MTNAAPALSPDTQPSFGSVAEVETSYSDTPECHRAIHDSFAANAMNDETLRWHRTHIEQNGLGFGIRAFHWLWKLMVQEMPQNFKFMEIGVYKGQVINLVGVLAHKSGKKAAITGLTPLGTFGDKYGPYEDVDYAGIIDGLESWSGVPQKATIIRGSSADAKAKEQARGNAPYDMIYIDGSHDYNMAAHDIVIYSDMVKKGGYLLVDDAGTVLRIPEGIFPGHPDVSRAVQEILALDPRFEEIFAVNHIRVFRKLAD